MIVDIKSNDKFSKLLLNLINRKYLNVMSHKVHNFMDFLIAMDLGPMIKNYCITWRNQIHFHNFPLSQLLRPRYF
jgi:hypothetical protein